MNSDASASSSRGIFAEIVRLQEAGTRAALATPVWTRGSVPAAYDAKLLLRADGTTRGTIGGGALEAAVLRALAEAIAEGVPRLVEYDLTASEAAGLGMLCGGRCAVLVEPVLPGREEEVFRAVAEAEVAGEPIVIISLLSESPPSPAPSPASPVAGALHDGHQPLPTAGKDWTTGKLALLRDGALLGTTGDGETDAALLTLALETLTAGQPQYVTDPLPAHLDPILPRPAACLFGAGHIGLVLANLTSLVGFRTVVVDDRPEFANRDRFPHADTVLVAAVDQAFTQLPVGEDTYLIAITRGHEYDMEVVEHGLRTPARYVGMIGSRRKVAAMREDLRTRGFTDEDLSRLHAPIGLPINSETVEEIAISIVAQLIAVRRG